MKVLLTTLNAKHIHSSLALRYLESYCNKTFPKITVQEYTINQEQDYILGEIYSGSYQVVCFSCYIWNITLTLQLIANLKKVSPKLLVVLGGPEVSFDPVEVMEQNNSIDYVVLGEGEVTFKELLAYLIEGKGQRGDIAGLAYREEKQIKVTEARALMNDLEQIPFPYKGDLADFEHKIIYYESSRGCPFCCSYCLSSTLHGVRFFPIERVKRDLQFFLDLKVDQVKFVDRTFNTKKSHSLEIMRFLHKHDNGHTNFHFEITADLLDKETLDMLAGVRAGLFQFEIGVQTTNLASLKAIRRPVDFSKLKAVVKTLASSKNIHLHLDLIAGLPWEDFPSFKKSFNDVYALKPEQLQLGFLKLLKGSPIRQEEADYGYIYKTLPPYEVLANNHITFAELLRLKRMEEMLELYYNSGNFLYSLDYVLQNFYPEAAEFYLDLSQYWEKEGYQHQAHHKAQLYAIILGFYQYRGFPCGEVFSELLKLDFLLGSKSPPHFLPQLHMEGFKNACHKFLQEEENVVKYLPAYVGLPAKNIMKKIHFEIFKYDLTEIITNPTRKAVVEQPTTMLFDHSSENKLLTKAKFLKVELGQA